ncbi:CDP-diacylglycerol--glycerol-3-phosphate 3-phosphatidyltransferase [Gorillibacterium sp. CAU 1737]|uniref:CDP-diacylglycerol--glycerol-3-phosphate 3-phosphatidyltransferase n=1 Tax=Gorillibacterium sp. CAU 1737 TaxID=3140362 RepID=UPI003260A030
MNLPNKITLARIFLVPIIVIILLINVDLPILEFKDFEITVNQIIGTLIFILAASTDSLDGYIARKNKLVTNLGKLLDPLADKLLVTAVLICLVQLGKSPAWMTIIIISREWAVTMLRQIAALEGQALAASKWGKWKTATQITAIIALLLNNFPFAFINFPFDEISMWVAVVITIYSGVDYFVKNKELFNMDHK